MAILDQGIWINGGTGVAEDGSTTITEGGRSTTVTVDFTGTWDETQGGYNIADLGQFGVTTAIVADYTFSNPVENLNFDFQHVNGSEPTYDDMWTIRAYDENGSLIDPNLIVAALSGMNQDIVYINPDNSVTLESEGTAVNNVAFNYGGLISRIELTLDNGTDAPSTGGSGISDFTFDIPVPDTDGDGVLDDVDIDDDNDGILDTEEGLTSTNPSTITITFDGDTWSNTESYWELRDASGTIIASDTTHSTAVEITNVAVTDLGEYTFTVTDSFGDGLSGGSNPSSYQVAIDGVTVVDSGPSPNFGSSISHNFMVEAVVTTRDTDGDGIADHLDLDSDDDGITDNVEAQSTEGYTAPTGSDADNDGLDDAYESTGGLQPVDTDGDGTDDYIDTDSDNDGILDSQETGYGISQAAIDASADTDGDGIKDVVDDVVGWDVNDTDVDGLGNFALADSDNDTAADGTDADGMIRNLDFRDNTPADGTVEGTAGADTIDGSYLGDPDGDRVDTGDAILAGHSGDDDLIYAYGGNDTITSGNGSDTVYGGHGSDSITGGAGNDILYGDQNTSAPDFVDPDTTSYYITNLGQLYVYNTVTGTSTQIQTGLTGFGDIAVADDGTLYGIPFSGGDSGIYRIDPVSGSETKVFDLPDGVESYPGLTMGPNGNLYYSDNSGNLNMLSPDGTGGFTSAGVAGTVGQSTYDIVFLDDSTAITSTNGSIVQYDVALDGTISNPVNLGGINGQADIYGLTVTADGTLYAIEGTGEVHSTDPTSQPLVWSSEPAANTSGGEIWGMAGYYDSGSFTPTNMDDTISGGDGSDSIYGGFGNDSLTGGSGNDLIYGDGGNDQIDTGFGLDTAYGGDGDDTISQGSTGTLQASLYGGAGNDTLYTGTGSSADQLYGGTGNDTLIDRGTGSQTFDGGDGDDTILAASGDDQVDGGAGNDTIEGGAGVDTLYGGDGNDLILGGTGADSSTGGAGDDTFVLSNAFGNDAIKGDETAETTGDTLDLSAITDNLTVDLTDANPETGTVSDGTSTASFVEIENIRLGGGQDTLVLADGSGSDRVEGFQAPTPDGDGTFTGVDMLDVTGLTNGTRPVNVTDVTVTDDGSGNAVLTFPNGENLTLLGISPVDADNPYYLNAIGIPFTDGIVEGTGAGDLIIGGYAGDPDGDVIDGNDAHLPGETGNDDIVYGYDGNDVIQSGDGNDEVYGGSGNDSVFGGSGNDDLAGGGGEDTLFGGLGDDTVDGGNDRDILYGGEGNDTIIGDAGADSIFGGSGDDVLDGGNNGDSFFYDDGFGNDAVIGGEGGVGDDVINFDGVTTSGVDVDYTGDEAGTATNSTNSVAFSEIEGVDLTDQNDTVDGSLTTTGIKVWSNAGDDTIIGGSGNDILRYGEGNDSVSGGDGDDFIDDAATATTGNNTVDGGAGNDTIYGSTGSDSLLGGSGNDTVNGDAGADVIDGGTGADTIDGGAGNDTITGGAGNDTISLGDNGAGSPDGDADIVVLEDGFGNDILTNIDAPINNGDGTFTGIDTLNVTGLNDATGTPVNTNDVVVTDDGSGNAVLTFPNGESVTLTGIDPVAADDPFYLNALGIPLPDGTVSGTAGADVIDVNYTGDPDGDLVDANDAILPGDTGNDDLIEAGAGSDRVYAGAGNDEVYGGTGQDTLDGGTGNDTLFGGADRDTFLGSTGTDVIDGGSTGNDGDTVNAYGIPGDLTVTWTGTEAGTITNGTDTTTFTEIEAFTTQSPDGTSGGTNDLWDATLAGSTVLINDYTGGADTFLGSDFADDVSIYGWQDARADGTELYGGLGDDYLNIEHGSGTIYGGEGNDSISMYGPLSSGLIDGGAGNDSVYTNEDSQTVYGGTGDDTIRTNDDADTIILEDNFGNDTINAGEGVTHNVDQDVLDASAVTTGLTVNITNTEQGTVSDGTSTASFQNVEELVLTGQDDVVTAGALGTGMTIEAGAGNDDINTAAATGSDTVFGGTGDDTISAGAGNDTIDGGADNDLIFGGAGEDSIDGGTGSDIINSGAGNDTISLGGDGFGGTDGDADVIVLENGFGDDIITDLDVPVPVGDGTFTGIDTFNVAGLTDAGGDPVNVNDVTVTDDGSGNAVLSFPNGESVTLIGVDPATADDPFWLNAMGIPLSDGTVSGTAGDDTIDATYVGDPDGDVVDGNDAILPGDTGNDDLIEAGEGNDTVFAGAGNDEVYGDNGAVGTLDWSDVAVTNGDGTTVVDGSGNSVGVTITGDGVVRDSIYGSGDYYAPTTSQTEAPVSTLLAFDSPVENVTFELYDVDSNGTTFDDQFTIIALDADGNQVPVTFSDLTHHTVSGNTVEGNNDLDGGGSGTQDAVTVTIPSAIVSLEIIYEPGSYTPTDGTPNTGLAGIGDVSFDIVPTDGNDSLSGGAGNDTLFGEAGDDTLDGGAGDDTIYGGDDDDTILLTNGYGNDTIIGGETGEVNGDTLDASALTGAAIVDLSSVEPGNPEAGTIQSGGFIIGGTMVGGSTAQFAEIENIILGSGSDTVLGSSGNDNVDLGSGSDVFQGGAGNDTVDLGSNGAGSPDGDADVVRLENGSGNDTIINFDAPTDNGDGTFTGIDTLDVTTLDNGNGVSVTTNDVVVSDDGSGNTVLTFPNGETITLVGIDPAVADNTAFLTAIGIPLPDGIVTGTSGADLIDATYSGDPDGDFVDASDAVIAGDGTNADRIHAGDGNDTVLAGIGDDSVVGGAGDDTIDGGAGDDLIVGDIEGANGGYVFLSNGDLSQYNPLTGQLDVIQSGLQTYGDIAQVPTGEIYGVIFQPASTTTDAGIYEIDPATGAETLVYDLPDNSDFYAALTSAPNGNLYLTNDTTGEVSILTPDGSGGFNPAIPGGTVDPYSKDLVFVDDNTVWVAVDGEIVEYDVDVSGALINPTNLGTVSGETDIFGLYLGDDGLVYAMEGSGEVYSTDPTSATLTWTEVVGLDTTTVFGAANMNTSVMAPGDDVLYGGLGSDTIYGGGGNDTIDGGGHDDTLYGGAGDDYIDGGFSTDVMDGGDGIDTVSYLNSFGNPTAETLDLDMEAGTAVLNGSFLETATNFENAISGNTTDTITGTSGANYISSGGGNDIIDGAAGDDTLDGGAGNDTLAGGAGDDTIYGGDDADYIFGGAGDTIVGGEGGIDNDTLILSDVESIAYGGGDNESGTVTFTAASGGGTLTFSEIENIQQIGPVDGTGGDDVMAAGYVDANNDTIDGADGNDDTIFGYGGNDSIHGGVGNDLIYGGTGNDTVSDAASGDTVYGGDGDDTITGTALDGPGISSLYGGDGNDTIDGLDRSDEIYGGAGDDVLEAGEEQTAGDNDTLYGGTGNDILTSSETAATGTDSLYGGDGNDIISIVGGTDNILSGGTGDDTLTSGTGNDTLFGGDDQDLFFGGGGDSVVGGEGGTDNDTLYLGEFGTTITYGGGDNESGTVEFADGSILTFSEIESIVPCFTPGTRVRTDRGDVAVESLRPGDMVLTRDAGFQPLAWVGKRHVTAKNLAANPTLRPVLIRQDAIGPDQPNRDMMVSPQHRMLMANSKVQLWLGVDEVLVKAKDMVHMPGIAQADVSEVTYVHIMFEHHQVVLADGAWSESFQPGDMVENGADQEMFREIIALFPELADARGRRAYTAARLSAKHHEAQLIA